MNRLGYLSAAWFTISHDENFGWAPNQTPKRGDKSRNALRVPKNMFEQPTGVLKQWFKSLLGA